MSTWKAKITEKGDALLAKMTRGSVMEITHAEVGAGQVDIDLLKQQTSVSAMKQTATVEYAGYPADGVCALPVTITNEGVSAGFSAWQIGVFANDPDEGTILFFLAQAEDVATSIPSAALMPSYNTQIIFYVEYGDADSVSVTVNPANAVSYAGMENYVNAKVGTAKEDLAAHTANKTNPHGVTAEQLGLGNVDNTHDTDKHVAYAQRAGEADKVQNSVIIRFNGGRTENTDMWTFDGSTGRTINVTPEKIGAAEAEHTHNYAGSSSAGGAATSATKLDTARDIRTNLSSEAAASFDGTKAITPGVTGILPIKHGGTEASTVADAQAKLGIITLDEIPNLYVWKKYTGEPGTYKETEVTNATIHASIFTVSSPYYTKKVKCSSEITISDNGASLTSPTDVTADGEKICGKYILFGETIYYIPEDAVVTTTEKDDGKTITSSSIAVRITPSVFSGYMASKVSDTYPTSGEHTDGYYYQYHKQLGE